MRALTTLLSTITALFVHAQSHTWSFALGGQGQDDVQAMAVSDFGHLYVAGYVYDDIVDMDPGTGQADQYSANSFLASYTTDGTYRWAYAFDGGGFTEAQLAAGNNGDVVIAGRWAGSGELDPGPGVVPANASGNGRLVVARYDSTGNHLWSFNIGGTNTESIAGLALDAAGNVYISGIVYGGCDFDPGPDTIMPFPNDFIQYNFLAKYAANGQALWARMLRGPAVFQKPVIAVDSAGNAYISGSVGDSLNLDPGFTNTVINGVGPVEDVYLARYRPDGSFHWGGVIGGSLDGFAHAIAANADGRVVVTGTYRGYYDFDMSAGTTTLMATIPGAYDAFVAVYDSTSALQWAKRFGNNGLDMGTAVRMDTQGEVALAGYYAGSITIGNFINGFGWDDAFLTRLDPNGNVLWAFGVGANDYDRASAVAMGADGATYLGGYFNNTIDLDPGTGTSLWTMVGFHDLFVARYDGLSTGIPTRTSPALLATPNPTADRVSVHANEPGTAQLIDATGQVIRVLRLITGPNTLDLSALPDRIYLLRGGPAAVRVVKQE